LQPGQAITLKRFPAYWDSHLPHLETVMLRAVTNATSRLAMLQSGEIDYALLAPLYQSAPSAADQDVVIVTSAPTGTFSVVFNTQRQPFADADVRRAVARAVDKAVLADQVLGSYGVPMNQPFNPHASPWYVDVADHAADLYAARALLSKAGYPTGLRITLPVIASATLFTKTAWALREQLQRVGIDLHVELSTAGSVRHRMQQNDWDVLLRGEEPYTDADDVYFEAFHSSRVGSSNISGYHTPTLDALLSTARHTMSLAERQQLYRQVVHKLQQDVPELYLFMARWPVAWRQRVQGYDGRLLQCCLLHTLTSIAHQGFKTIWLSE
jgi:peptide/nickel transport system substrate-binding protein